MKDMVRSLRAATQPVLTSYWSSAMSIASAENGWINTRDSQHPAILERAHRILTQTIYCSISTCSQEGVPWASPVFFTYWSLD
jgi:hypothetical protein